MSPGVGIFAGAHYTAAGGSVSVISETPIVHNTNTVLTINLATTLLSSDLVMIISRAAGTPTLTWSAGTMPRYRYYRSGGSSGPLMYIHSGTGVSGSGVSITYTPGGTSFTHTVTPIIVRGLSTVAITAFQESTFFAVDGTATGAETNTTTEQTPSTTIGTNQVAFFLSLLASGISPTAPYPDTSTPGSGWTTVTTGTVSIAYYIGTSPGTTVQGQVRTSTASQKGVVMLTVG